MLILSRKKNERIVFTIAGVRVEVVVVRIRGDKVGLGIDAPLEVAVHRLEVYEAIERQRKAAAEPATPPSE